MTEVFVSDAFLVDEFHYVVGAQWPRDHVLYHPDETGVTDSLLFVETFRQSMVYLAHTFQEIPLTHHFIGRRLEFQITDPAPLRTGPAPLIALLDIRWTPTGGRPPGRYEFRVDAGLIVGGAPAGRATLEVMAIDARRYAMLRRPAVAVTAATATAARGVPVPASEVGHSRSRDSVLRRGTQAGQWWLAADLEHVILFDHPTDHVPLMVLTEGFRQLGHLLMGPAGSTLRAMTVDCHTFAELDRPLALVARGFTPVPGLAQHHDIRIDAMQDERCVASCGMGWSASRTEAGTRGISVLAAAGPAS